MKISHNPEQFIQSKSPLLDIFLIFHVKSIAYYAILVSMKFSIRLLYLYLFSFVGLLITVIGMIQLVNLGLKVYVFQGADQYNYYDTRPVKPDGTQEEMTTEEQMKYEEKMNKQQEEETQRQRKREAANAIAMIVIGVPLYIYHWATIKREGT